MSKPKTQPTPQAPQPDAPAPIAVFGQEDSPATAVQKKALQRRYLTAGPAAASSTSTNGVGVNL